MKFVFVDEAGIPHVSKKSTVYFVLAGLVIDDSSLLPLEESLQALKRRFGLHPFTEFKWNARYSNHHLSYTQFVDYRNAVFGLINKHSETVVATVIRKYEAFKKTYINSEYDLYKQALLLLMERVHYHYQDNADKFPVMFVIDSRNRNEDDMLRHAYRDAIRSGTFFTDFYRFSETPYFVESSHSAGLQFADYCVGPIQQCFENGKDDWYKALYPSIRKCPRKDTVLGCGIKIFP